MSAAWLALSAIVIVIASLALALRQARLAGIAVEQARQDEREAKIMRKAQEIMAGPLPSRDAVLERMRATDRDASALPKGGCQSGGGAGADR